MKHAHNYKDHTGEKHNRVTFLRYVETDWKGNAFWRVRCDCGVEFNTRAASVLNGNTKSCGCLRTEINKTRYKKHNTL